MVDEHAAHPTGGAAANVGADGADGADGTDGADANSPTQETPGVGGVATGDGGACDALVAATMENPGAPFAPDIVRDLAALKRANRVLYELLRTKLKRAGCRVTELDPLVAEENDEGRDGKPPSQSDLLIALSEAAELFRTPDEAAYADIEVDGRRETWPVKSRGFRSWLARGFFEQFGGAATGEAVKAAIEVIEAKALHDTPVRDVFVRVGEHDSKFYLDLTDADWRAVEIDRTGWRVVDRPAVRFRRSRDMQPLPEPASDGSVDGLRPLLNISPEKESDGDFILAVAFALACLRPRGPYPAMAIGGEQGSAKSTRSRLLRNVVDPRHPPLRSLPHDERDLVVAARNQHVLAFDNVSGLRTWLSDALCRIASGAGFGTRELYTDQEEVLFSGARPIILNGIEEIVERPDLAERSLFATCEPIESENRLSEEEVLASFDAAHASILGALLDAVAMGLKRFSEVRPPSLPRMADFAHWAVACEAALWKDGDFLRAYSANILGAVESVLEASPVAVAVRELMGALRKEAPPKETWEGTASELLTKLTSLVSERVAKSETWPSTARALSGRLRRAASFLRRVGTNVAFRREGHAMQRRIVITAGIPPTAGRAGERKFASASSAPSASGAAPSKTNDLGEGGADAKPEAQTQSEPMQTQTDVAQTQTGAGDRPYRLHANPLNPNEKDPGADGADGTDAKIRFPDIREEYP